MRRCGEDKALAMSNDQIVGINLGWSFCAEHEWGIKSIRNEFGISAETQAITKIPQDLKFFEDLKGYSYLIFSDQFNYIRKNGLTAERLNEILEISSSVDEALSTAWDGERFGIRMKNQDNGVNLLKEIYAAFTRMDIVIFLNPKQNIFGGTGLVIAIRSRIEN